MIRHNHVHAKVFEKDINTKNVIVTPLFQTSVYYDLNALLITIALLYTKSITRGLGKIISVLFSHILLKSGVTRHNILKSGVTRHNIGLLFSETPLKCRRQSIILNTYNENSTKINKSYRFLIVEKYTYLTPHNRGDVFSQ